MIGHKAKLTVTGLEEVPGCSVYLAITLLITADKSQDETVELLNLGKIPGK